MKKLEDFLVTGIYEAKNPREYYSTKTGISGTPTEHAMAARKKAEQRLASGEELDANDLFYLKYIGQGAHEPNEKGEIIGTKMSSDEIARIHGYASSERPSQRDYSIPAATSTLPDSDLPPTDTRISGAYWPTYKDFFDATGQKYDPKNSQHRQLFFDLTASGEPTWAATAGVGQGPSYDSLEYHTMRRRPASLPKYDQYGRVPDQTYSGVWSPSDPALGPKAAAQKQRNREEIISAERRELANQPLPGPSKDELEKVSKELGMSPEELMQRSDYALERYGTDEAKLDSLRKRNYIDDLTVDLEDSGLRSIQEPPRLPKPPSFVQRGISGLVQSGEEEAKKVGQKISDYMKLNLAQTMPISANTKLYGEPAGSPNWSDQQRGQFTYDPMYERPIGMVDDNVVSHINLGTVDIRDLEPENELSDFEGFGYPFPRETTMPGLVAAAALAGQQHGGMPDPELFPEVGQPTTPAVAATVANLSGADATRPAAKGFKFTGLPKTASELISRYGKNKKFSERPATPKPEDTEKESLNKIISDEPFTWARDVAQRGGTRPPLVVRGSGFEPESAGQERLNAQQYQERAARFKKIDAARKAADLEYTRATGKLATAQKTAVSQYAYQDIFKRQLKKMGFSSKEINDIIGLD